MLLRATVGVVSVAVEVGVTVEVVLVVLPLGLEVVRVVALLAIVLLRVDILLVVVVVGILLMVRLVGPSGLSVGIPCVHLTQTHVVDAEVGVVG